jgi:low affinity Fe/Cu permease
MGHDPFHSAGRDRDTQAIHAKHDELLRAQSNVDERLTTVDREEPEEIAKRRERAEV